jgi:hypothetical protein
MGITAIVCIAAIVLLIVIVLTILVYNQMLLLNEVNKRLLLMARESVEKERMTQEELQDALVTIEQMSNETANQVQSNPSKDNPEFLDEDLEI